jgi:hypothetical protein
MRIADITAKIVKDVYQVFGEVRRMNVADVWDFCGKWKETENFRGDIPIK